MVVENYYSSGGITIEISFTAYLSYGTESYEIWGISKYLNAAEDYIRRTNYCYKENS